MFPRDGGTHHIEPDLNTSNTCIALKGKVLDPTSSQRKKLARTFYCLPFIMHIGLRIVSSECPRVRFPRSDFNEMLASNNEELSLRPHTRYVAIVEPHSLILSGSLVSGPPASGVSMGEDIISRTCPTCAVKQIFSPSSILGWTEPERPPAGTIRCEQER